jgi:hypothetical protein
MKKIEESLRDWFEKNCKDKDIEKILNQNLEILKEAFIAGYHQSMEDRKIIEGIR